MFAVNSLKLVALILYFKRLFKRVISRIRDQEVTTDPATGNRQYF